MKRQTMERVENNQALRNLLMVGAILASLAFAGCGVGAVGYPIPGPKGDRGSDGQPGAPGTQITVVQLCPNNGPAVYPTVFPESAMCISGKLYGIYNTQNGGLDYLSELPPGNYASIAPSGCHLVIGLNCAVVQQ